MQSPHCLAYLLIGPMCYRAGIHDNQVSIKVIRGFLKAFPVQAVPDCTAIGLVAATAEGANEESRHCGIS
jgi:hypothetical protein